MVGIVDCRPIDHYIALEHRQKFGDRDRFGVGDQESVKRTFERRPAPDPNRDPRPIKVDRCVSAFRMCYSPQGIFRAYPSPALRADFLR